MRAIQYKGILHCPMTGLLYLALSNDRAVLSCTVQWEGCFILHCPMGGLAYLALSNHTAVLFRTAKVKINLSCTILCTHTVHCVQWEDT